MTNAQITAKFLAAIETQTRQDVLNAVAKHYGITAQQAHDELIDPEAEHLLDYLTGAVRLATSVLMQRHGFRNLVAA